MMKILTIFALLFFYIMVGPVEADFCLTYGAPESFDSSDLAVIRKELSKSVKAEIQKSCGDDMKDFEALIRMIGPDTFMFSYGFTYGWRAGGEFHESLLYDKKNGKWIFRQSLNNIAGDLLELNGDGIPELLKVHYFSMRTYSEHGNSILAIDKADGKYKDINGLSVFDGADYGVGCQEGLTYTEDLKIDESGNKYPVITLSRKNFKRKDCDDEEIITEKWQYQWDPANKKYMNKGYSNSLQETVSFEPEGASDKTALFYEKQGDRKKLGSTFSKESSLFAFFRANGYLYFKAEDKDWLSEYAWDVEKNELYYQAKNKKTGKKYYSKGETKAVFEKIPWINNAF